MANGLKMRMLANGSRQRTGNGDYRNDNGWNEGNRNDDRYGSGSRNRHENSGRMYNEREGMREQRGEMGNRGESMRNSSGYMRSENGRRNGMYEDEDQTRMNRAGGRREENRDYEWDGEDEPKRQSIQAGGTFWMEAPQEDHKLTREKAKEWVHHMRNSDPAFPTGEKWSMDELKGLAQKKGIDPDSEKFFEFYAVMNGMYSDYAEVAKQFGVSKPEFYAAMAAAWMNDKDAKDGKTALYYKYIAKK